MYSYLAFLGILVTINAVNGQFVGVIYDFSNCQSGTSIDNLNYATDKCFINVCPASVSSQSSVTPCSAQYTCNGNEVIETQYSDPVCQTAVQTTVYTIGQCSAYVDMTNTYVVPSACTPNAGPPVQTVVEFLDANCTNVFTAGSGGDVVRIYYSQRCLNQYLYSCPNTTGANVQIYPIADSCVEGGIPVMSYGVGQCLPGNVKVDCGSGIGYNYSGGGHSGDGSSSSTGGSGGSTGESGHTSDAWKLDSPLRSFKCMIFATAVFVFGVAHDPISYR